MNDIYSHMKLYCADVIKVFQDSNEDALLYIPSDGSLSVRIGSNVDIPNVQQSFTINNKYLLLVYPNVDYYMIA